MANRFEQKYGGSAPAPSAPPAVIYGAPPPGQAVDLARDQVGLQRDQQSLAIEAERLRLSQAAEARQQAEAARKAADEDRKRAAMGGAVDASVEQGKAASFYHRAVGSNSRFGELETQGLGAPSVGRTAAQAVLPDAVVNTLTDDQRQLGDAEQRNFIGATLRYESGAAIPPEEFATQSRIFFPQPGDSAATVDRKRQLRAEALEGLRGAAGPAISNLRAGEDSPTLDPNKLSVAQMAELEKQGYALDPQSGMYEKGLSDGSVTDTSEVKPASPFTDSDRGGIVGTIDSAVRGFADTVTLGYADELAAAGDTIFGGGTMEENLRRQRGIDAQDERVNPYARIGGQVAGGFALPTGAATGARGLATVGALYGAGYGSGSAEGSVSDRLIGAAKGAAGGAVVGGALGAAGRLIPRGGGPNGGGGSAVAQAGRELGITPMAADVGGPMTGRLTSGVAQTLGGAGPIMRGAQRVQQGASDRLSAIAATEGTPVRQEVLGETAQRAAQGYIDDSGRAGGELYREARSLAGNTRIQGRQALDTLDSNIAELGQTPNTSAAVIDGLSRFRDDLAVTLENGATARRRLPVDAIRALRTNVRAEAQTEGLRATDYQRRANQVLDSLSEDIASQLPADAQAAFRRADNAWRERLDTIDNVMEQVIGPNGDRSAEAVANRLINMSRGDSARLRTFVNSIGQEEAGVVRGSLIQELGRANSGQQNAAGDAFSLGGFLSNFDKLPERTRNLLFRGDNRQAIENLAVLAEGSRNASRFANTSNTGGAVNASNAIQNASAIAGWSSLGGSLIAENLTARMLASPAVARILARPPVDKARAIRRFAEAAVRDPAIAPDITRFTQALESGSNRAAAQEDNK